jgi:hypothetical protein
VFVVAYCVEVLFLERLWCAGLCVWGIDKGGRFKIGVGVCASRAYRSWSKLIRHQCLGVLGSK